MHCRSLGILRVERARNWRPGDSCGTAAAIKLKSWDLARVGSNHDEGPGEKARRAVPVCRRDDRRLASSSREFERRQPENAPSFATFAIDLTTSPDQRVDDSERESPSAASVSGNSYYWNYGDHN